MTTAAEDVKRLTAGTGWKAERLDRSVNHLPLELIAGALPEDKFQQTLILSKYAGHQRNEAYNFCRLEFSHTIINKAWDIPEGVEIYRAMCRLAVDEVCDEPKCKKCKGRGEVWLKGIKKPVSCDLCEGTGTRSINDEQRYRLIQKMPYGGLHEVSERDWFNKWRHRNYEAFSLAMEAHNNGVIYMNRQLRELDEIL